MQTTHESWADTLQRLANGDSHALARTKGIALAQLVRMGACRYRDGWEDVVQEVLLSLLRCPPRLSGDASIVCHIRTTTRRKLFDLIRRERGRRRSDDGDAGAWRTNVPLETADEVEAPEIAPELRLDLERALARLGPRERAAVTRRHLYGESNAEAARRLGVSLATLKRRVRCGLDELRRSLDGAGPALGDLVSLPEPTPRRSSRAA